MTCTRRRFCAGSIVTIGLFNWPKGATAHRVPLTVTTISRQGDLLSIAHRLHAHDAMQLLETMKSVTRPDITIVKNQARIALYMADAFLLKNAITSEEYQAKIIGAELEGNYFFIYQEIDLSLLMQTPTSKIVLKSTALKSISPEWLHHVNIETPTAENRTVVQSLTFSNTPKWQDIDL